MTTQRASGHWTRGGAAAPAGLALCLAALAVFVVLLAACGQTSVSSQASVNGPADTPSAPTTTASRAPTTPSPASAQPASGQKAGGSANNGCADAQAPADAATFKADVIVSQSAQGAGAAQPITLAQGQRLEIRLAPSYSWELSASDPGHTLAGANPEGWYDAGAQACIWRFTAQGAGSAQLTFSGAAVCPYLKLCPSVEQTIAYGVTVR
jgi:hypothetical protein